MKKSKVIALLLVSVMLFGVVQSVYAGSSQSGKSEGSGILSRVVMAVIGGTAGFSVGGIPGAVMGAGFMAIVSPGCFNNPFGPISY